MNLRYLIKDIANLSNRNINDIVAVDDNLSPFSHVLSNVVPILPFRENRNDTELLKLIPFLKYVSRLEDHQEFLQQYFKLDALAASPNFESAIVVYLK